MKARVKLLLLLLPPLLLSGFLIKVLTGQAVKRTLQDQAASAARASTLRTIDNYGDAISSGKETRLLPVLYHLKTTLNASEAAFVDNAGIILAHTDVAQRGKTLPLAQANLLSGKDTYHTGTAPGAGTMQVYIPAFEPAPQEPEELTLLGPDSGKRLGTIIVSVPISAAIAAEKGISEKISVILLIIYSGILLTAFIITGLALRPVRLLTEGTRRIRLGDYGTVIPVTSEDEFGELARSFNEMTSTLSGTIVSKNYLDAVVDNIADILLVTDLDCRILRLNKAANLIFGRDNRGLIGTSLEKLFSKEPSGNYACKEKLQREGELRDFETILITPAPLPVSVSASFIKDTEGSRSGIVLLVKDISLRKKYEAEMARSNEDLQRFAFVASHDLQEPLRTISSFIHLLEHKYKDILGPDAGRDIGFITSAVTRMRSLVRDLLDYSRINSELKVEQVETGKAFESVLAAMNDSIRASGAVIEAGPLPVIRADRGQIERLLQNLISNAVKFTDGATPSVKVAAVREEGGWVFSVADNGEGIDPKYAGKLFKIFGRLHGAGTEGSGIGLASCKRIVETYGGRIWFESRPGHGSIFSFSIPDQPGQ